MIHYFLGGRQKEGIGKYQNKGSSWVTTDATLNSPSVSKGKKSQFEMRQW